MNMKKRDVIISLILSVVFGLLVLCTFTEVLCANEPICTEPIVEETTLCTTEPTDAIEEATEPSDFQIEDILFDKNLCYYKFDDKTILIENIEKCNNYIAFLEQELIHYTGHDAEKIYNEINRITEIIEQYTYDLNFTDKTVFNVPEIYNQRDFKSYESYKAITSKTSPHYKLQNQYAITGPEGIRKVDDRFCVALGSYFTTTIGQYVDVVLANGTIIPCILGDQKSDKHTDELHIAHMSDGSIVEFIVDLDVLNELPRKMGNISYVYPEWRSPVVQVIVYDTNFFEISDEVAQDKLWVERAEEYPVATKLWLWMKNELQWNDYICAGVMGNFMAETGGHTLNIQPERYGSSGKSYGLCQWPLKWDEYSHLEKTDLDYQINFIQSTLIEKINRCGWEYLQRCDKNKNLGFDGRTELYEESFKYEDFIKMQDYKEAALAFAASYMRCNEKYYEVRAKNAAKAYEYFTSDTRE